MKTTEYNGHKDWAHWNVALWLFNEEPSYRMVIDEIKRSKTIEDAAETILHRVPKSTPDGAEYTYDNILAAIESEEHELNWGRGPIGRATMDR